MKIYRVDFHDADEGAIVEWYTSKSEAHKHLRSLQKDRDTPQGLEAVTLVDIPTDRAGLVNWLNRHLTRDNG